MNLKLERIIPNLRIHSIFNNTLIASKGYKIYASNDLGMTWKFCNTVPVKYNKRTSSSVRIMARLLRNGISSIIQLFGNKVLICCDREMFLSNLDLDNFEKVNVPIRFFQLLDNNICKTDKFVYYGEYFPNSTRDKVNIYFTKDGLDWELIYSFPKKTIRHIHLLQYDRFSDRIWFSTGDLGEECIMGNANYDFSDIETVGENDQKWRCVEMLFDKDYIYWGSEDPNGTNWLLSFDRKNHMLKKLMEVYTPVYNLKKLTNGYILITANERGEWDKRAHIWCASDIEKKWQDCISFEKDRYPCVFGFGRLVYGCADRNRIFLTGKGLKEIDNCSIVLGMQD